MSAIVFLLFWSLILTGARSDPDFPEALYDLAIIGSAFRVIGETALAGIIAVTLTLVVVGSFFSLLSSPTLLRQVLSGVLDVSPLGLTVRIQEGESIRDRLEKLEAEVSRGINKADLETLSTKVSNTFSRESGLAIIQTIESKYSKQVREDAHSLAVEEAIERLYLDLARERQTVSFRSGLNLLIGIALGIIGVAALYFTLLAGSQSGPPVESMTYYIPRVALSVLVQALAFFFLALYRSGLQDVKYFRNEMTNIGLIRLAIRLALEDKYSSSMPDVIAKLAASERNFVLRKGESSALTEAEQVGGIDEKTANIIEKTLDIIKNLGKPPQ